MTTRRALVFSFLDRYASLLIAVASSMVIARLLTPAEIGVFSITMVLLMFVSAVRDMGAGQYLIQEKDLTTERLRAVWAVQLGLGLALACLVLLASYPVAIFYDEPRMRDIMLVVALNYAVNPFGAAAAPGFRTWRRERAATTAPFPFDPIRRVQEHEWSGRRRSPSYAIPRRAGQPPTQPPVCGAAAPSWTAET